MADHKHHKSHKRLSQEQIERKIETIRKNGDRTEDDEPFEFDDITGVTDFVLAKTKAAGDKCIEKAQESIAAIEKLADAIDETLAKKG